ncbi:trypsin-like peptidase domain-containing protein [Entomospira culicis]|uniref:PDZ domain-containing protein n=1 Tax=Entomospira culicis TaxID=2719989 RepID=A0A968GDZ1_9SPIO|nr:trypsin-like peptidase domain-containing protein [Entomospira culicis]NIZ18562.1 PDZ domain-containing protein [Entomospira culicis]NIZ68778.1 PDZ domain-containing protein [Entomospira culicis]WDI37374.1 trypsin-like peptidase domain-containing protein [Entomospira culicis]WDI39003.1 trypsin-like peptidase domain-containing protein [Entomospira culicis]
MEVVKKSWFKSLLGITLIVVVSVFTTYFTLFKIFQFQGVSALAQESEFTLPRITQSDFQEALREVSAQTLRGVVRVDAISIKRVPVRNQQNPWDFFFSQEFFNRSEEPNEEREFRSGNLGTGFVVEREGNTLYILTNYHVAGEATEVSVDFFDGRTFTAEILAGDERRDLALLKVDVGNDNDDILALPLGDSNDLVVGDWILAAGSPFGYDFTVTSGMISALGRTGGPRSNINDFIQSDASINQGNSGGPLVNMRGEVVGINTWIATQNGGSIGLSFSVPINNAKEVLPYLKKGKTPEYGWVGITVIDLRALGGEEYAKSAGFSQTRGAVVSSVIKGSPAEKGGLMAGDLVLSINDQAVNSADRVVYLVSALPVGSKANVLVVRDGKEQLITLNIEARAPESTVNSQEVRSWPGLIVVPLTDALRNEWRIEKSVQGVVVASIDRGSGLAVLRPNDIITSVNGQRTQDVQSFYRLINDPKTNRYEIIFRRENTSIEITIRRE